MREYYALVSKQLPILLSIFPFLIYMFRNGPYEPGPLHPRPGPCLCCRYLTRDLPVRLAIPNLRWPLDLRLRADEWDHVMRMTSSHVGFWTAGFFGEWDEGRTWAPARCCPEMQASLHVHTLTTYKIILLCHFINLNLTWLYNFIDRMITHAENFIF